MTDDKPMQDIVWTDCPLVQLDFAPWPVLRSSPRTPIEALVVNHLDGETVPDIAYMFEVDENEVGAIIAYYQARTTARTG
jgi:hypothetical protein